MRQTAFFFLLLFIQTGVSAQTTDYRKQQNYKEWVHLAPKFNDAFFRTEEAQRIGDNVLLYQQVTGGWPKNIYMPAELTEQEYTKAWNAKGDVNQSTIDNNATTTEIQYLARLYQATQKEKYKEGVLKGIQYLLKAQYDNGGWPQFYPRPTGYYIQITYNDNAMVRVMQQLREIYEKQSPYTFIPDETCQQARKAFDKGIECILRTQVRQNGELTVWCAQHDRITLEPCKARAYELPSLSGQESDNIVLLLMSLPHPSEKVIESIESAVKWFKKSEIKGIQKECFRYCMVITMNLKYGVKKEKELRFMNWTPIVLSSPTATELKNTISQKSDMNAGTDIAGTIKTATKYWQNMRNGKRN